MIGVDLTGQIRRAYFEQHRSIKEIVRTLKASRATVRKVIRSHKTEFKYTRGVQPTPKLGDWVEALTEIIEKEAKLPKRERRSTQRLFEELRGNFLRGVLFFCRNGFYSGCERTNPDHDAACQTLGQFPRRTVRLFPSARRLLRQPG
jgi:hypothetical protein